MPTSFVTGAIAQSMFGTTLSMKTARKRSTRGLSMRQTRKIAASAKNSTAIRMRRTGPLKSASVLRSLAKGGLAVGAVPKRAPRRAPGGSAVVIYHVAELFFILQRLAGAKGDAVERLVGDGDRKPRLLAQRKVQFAQERAAARQHHAAVHNVGRKVGRRRLERGHHRLADLLDRLGERLGDLGLVDLDLLRHAVQKVAAADRHGGAAPVVGHPRGADRG